MDNSLSSVYTAAEIADMRSTIDDIQKILQNDCQPLTFGLTSSHHR